MINNIEYSDYFSRLLSQLPSDEQLKVIKFIEQLGIFGLQDFKRFPGKIADSSRGNPIPSRRYSFAKDNNLWHYHIGHPSYQSKPTYQTSDYIVHFMWIKNDKEHTYKMLDYTPHKIGGKFPIPTTNKFL